MSERLSERSSEIEKYLGDVAGQIRVKRVREPLVRELRGHIEDQAAAYQAEGVDESDARRLAVEGMGDALYVGGELDRAHRPRVQWTGLFAALFLIALGLAAQTVLYGFGLTQIASDLRLPASLCAAGLIALFALSDYTWWVRLSVPVAALWFLFWLYRMDYVVYGRLFETRGFLRAFVNRYAVMLFSEAVPQILCASSPAVLALVACALRGRRWGAFALCTILCLMPTALALGYRGTGYDPNAALFMALLCPVALAISLRKGFFAINRGAAYALVALLFAYPLWTFASDLLKHFTVRQSYIEDAIRPLVLGARLIGPGSSVVRADYLNNHYFLAGAIHRFGWLPFTVFTMGVGALIMNCISRFLRMSNRMGSLIGFSAALIISAQTALFYLASFTDYSENLCLPLVSRGNTMLLLDAVLVGLILSSLRGRDLPEADMGRASRATA